MSNIFCSQCGSKHTVGSKFCSSCGSPLSSFSAPKRTVQNIEIQEEPNSFTRPRKLSYEVHEGGNNVFKGEDLFKSAPVNEEDKLDRSSIKVKKMTQEGYLSESLKECAPRGMQDIDET